ncbi:MAG: polymer-forming cytoskeletal protein [Deltaproteobacteria bacterium]|jgi:cytoskeletal protein CcmA (bactofilin family)|nr:polymer-forming cytoskeletal protein [Deltaproteobacteria bacterium]
MFGKNSKNGKLGKHVWNAFFASSVEIEGSLRFSGLLNIDGNLTGAIVAKGMLVTGNNATVTGDIFVENLIISGTVKGNIYATGEVHLNNTAKVIGNINYNSLSIIPGAFHEGNSHFFTDQEREELTARIHEELHLPPPNAETSGKNKKGKPQPLPEPITIEKGEPGNPSPSDDPIQAALKGSAN